MINKKDPLIKVNCLGSFYIESSGDKFGRDAWQSKQALTLFKYLSAHRGEKFKKDYLMELLWPENSFDKKHNLHTVIYYLRRALKKFSNSDETASFVKHSDGLYWLEENSDLWIDIEEFENIKNKIQGKGMKPAQKSENIESVDLYKSALSLYNGNFLANDKYIEWTKSLRQYYLNNYIELTLEAADIYNKNWNHKEAVNICQDALEFAPLREELYRKIMSIHYKNRNHNRAIETYKNYQKKLEEEFNLEPSTEINNLYHEIKDEKKKEENDMQNRGAFFSAREKFEDIFKLQSKQLERRDEELVLMSVNAQNTEKNLVEKIKRNLRSGDIVTQWDDDKLLIQLFSADRKAADKVKNRLGNIISENKNEFSIKSALVNSKNSSAKLKKFVQSSLR